MLTAPSGDDRLFVVEQAGRIRIMKRGILLSRPFLDLSDRVMYRGERGLLNLAFHPDYARNGLFYVYFTDREGTIRIERFSRGRDPDLAEAGSARPLLSIEHGSYANHNGGLLLFGPDGMLYIGVGDGGGAGDPLGSGQSLGTLLGKLLRIDVDHGEPYTIPADNPFLGRRDARAEIWAYGLRNPWRCAFDRDEGLLYIADVGQDRWEEIDISPAASGGLNYGWNLMEGNHPFASGREVQGLVPPVLEYGHGEGCSVTGGFVYRGSLIPALSGSYLYGDYCSGWIRSFRWAGGVARDGRELYPGGAGRMLSFGEDSSHEAYVLTDRGIVYRILAAP